MELYIHVHHSEWFAAQTKKTCSTLCCQADLARGLSLSCLWQVNSISLEAAACHCLFWNPHSRSDVAVHSCTSPLQQCAAALCRTNDARVPGRTGTREAASPPILEEIESYASVQSAIQFSPASLWTFVEFCRRVS